MQPKLVAAAGLGLVLIVVLVSAAIRLSYAGLFPVPLLGDGALAALRGVHRTAASLEVLAALWLAWLAWRGRVSWKAVSAVGVLTVFLSLLGIVAGKAPTQIQSLGNLLGGLALVTAFAWILGEMSGTSGRRALTPFSLGLLFLQAFIGARLSIFARYDMPALPAHALLGIAAAALVAWIALARIGAATGKLVFVLALAAPVAGFTALHYEYSAGAALVHAASAAALVASAAFALGRNA